MIKKIQPTILSSDSGRSYKSEHWGAVQLAPKVTINKSILKIKVSPLIHMLLKVKHRLENEQNSLNLIFFEVKTGFYLGENNIIRYKDKYAR